MTGETVLSLPVFDFIGYLAAARKAIEKEKNEKYRISAHIGWQTYSLIAAMFQNEKNDTKIMDYSEYLSGLGLLSKEEMEQMAAIKHIREAQARAENQRKAAESLKKAENILSMDKARRRKKEV